jgi:hypothetical protein
MSFDLLQSYVHGQCLLYKQVGEGICGANHENPKKLYLDCSKNMRCIHIPKVSFVSIVRITSIFLKKYENNEFSDFCHFI